MPAEQRATQEGLMKKERSKRKKLSLSKETVRVLSERQLGHVAGADTDRCTNTCTYTCTEICTYGPTAECSGTC
jgi:natural product precursor